MRSLARGWRRAALGAALLAGAPAALAVPAVVAAPTAADGPCEGTSGVTVVVDFGTLGGGVQTRCAPEPVSSGFEALDKAGFAVDVVQGQWGFLCRIDGKPANEPCTHTPPANYYWGYWTASTPGGAWAYSGSGASRDPAPGSVDGWAFSDGCTRKPGASTTCPSSTITTTTTSAPTTTRPSATGGATGGSGGSAPATAPAASGGTTLPAAPGRSDSLGTKTTEGGTALRSADKALPEDDNDSLALGVGQDTAAPNTADAGSGSPAGVVASAAAVLLLGLGAAGRQRQRRRSAVPGSGSE